ncbi:MAG: ABC transporter permease [Pseudomonadota bacterium]
MPRVFDAWLRKFLYQTIGIGVIVAIWFSLPASDSRIIPPLGRICQVGLDMFITGTLPIDIWVSIKRVTIGILIGISLASIIGLFCVIEIVRSLIVGPLEFARPIPPIAWIPLMLVIFGVGDYSSIALVAFASFFPIASSFFLALDSVDKDLILTARSLGASDLSCVFRVYIPTMLPIVLNGIKTGAGIGWFSVVASEMLGSHGGLGYGLQTTSLNLDMERFFVYLIIIGFCGYFMNFMFQLLDNKFNYWYEKGSCV